jgi:hypothetical protein
MFLHITAEAIVSESFFKTSDDVETQESPEPRRWVAASAKAAADCAGSSALPAAAPSARCSHWPLGQQRDRACPESSCQTVNETALRVEEQVALLQRHGLALRK